MWTFLEQLNEIIQKDIGFQINSTNSGIRIRHGLIKADRSALSRIFGYLSGRSPSREGIFCV